MFSCLGLLPCTLSLIIVIDLSILCHLKSNILYQLVPYRNLVLNFKYIQVPSPPLFFSSLLVTIKVGGLFLNDVVLTRWVWQIKLILLWGLFLGA